MQVLGGKKRKEADKSKWHGHIQNDIQAKRSGF